MRNLVLLLTIALIASLGALWWVCRPKVTAEEQYEEALEDVNGFWLGSVYLANDFEVISDEEDLRRKVVPLIRNEPMPQWSITWTENKDTITIKGCDLEDAFKYVLYLHSGNVDPNERLMNAEVIIEKENQQ